MDRRHRQRGAAIVTAMLVVTLAAVVVSSLFWREHVAVRSVENRLALAQARWIERAALDWAKVILRADFRTSPQVDHLQETWAIPVLDTRMDETVTAGAKIDDGARQALLAGQVTDAQSRFNLTSLVDANGQPVEPYVKALQRLLSIVGKPESAADPIVQRVQQSVPRTAQGRTLPAQRPPLVRLADLLDVAGLDPTVVAALQPHAIVLPTRTPVNVNTASAEVIAALAGIGVADARRIIARRERVVFASPAQALEAAGVPIQSPIDAIASVRSDYFLVVGVIRYDRVESQTETLLNRMADRVEVVWQLRL
jgi:general secretion pathway protein K